MSTNTSIGSSPDRGGNDDRGNADGCGNKTLGDSDQATEQPPTGAEGKQPFPSGPNVGPSAGELDAARGDPPRKSPG